MNLRKRAIASVISLAIYSGIFLLSSLPAKSLPSGIPDVIPHSLEFFVLAFFFIQIFLSPGRPATMALALFLLAVMGLLDECHQLSVPGRVFSLLDLLYDTFGAMAGIAAHRVLAHTLTNKKTGKIARLLDLLLLHR
jgi:VanZ family protein